MPGKPIAQWPCWYHSPNGESKIFQSIQEVPYGWQRTKPKPFNPVKPLSVDKEAVIAELLKRDVIIDPRWGAAQLQKVLDDSCTSR